MSRDQTEALAATSGIPGMALLLSDDLLRCWLAERGHELEQRCYLRYKPRTSCVASVRLTTGPAYLLAVAPGARTKLDKAMAQARPSELLASDRSSGVVLATPAADRALPALGDLRRTWDRLLPDTAFPAVATLVHKPQRRWVGLASPRTGEPPVLLRAYRRGGAADASARLRLSRRVAKDVHVPRLLATSKRRSCLAVSYLPGASLQGRRRSNAAPHEVAAAGEALAKVHAAKRPSAVAVRVATPTETAALVGSLLPNLAERVNDAAAELAAKRPATPEPALCHGDFSLDQVVVGPNGEIGLIDWDRAGTGAPAMDLASALAAGLDQSATDELLAGYTRLRTPPADLEWHVATARLMRLAEPFRLARPDWDTQVAAGLAVIEATLP